MPSPALCRGYFGFNLTDQSRPFQSKTLDKTPGHISFTFANRLNCYLLRKTSPARQIKTPTIAGGSINFYVFSIFGLYDVCRSRRCAASARPVRMEKLAPWFIDSFISMGTEVVSLCLQ